MKSSYFTIHRSETNGTAERAVRRIKETTSAELLQSGLDEKWWADSVECYCYLRHVQDLLADGKTPKERRFGEPFKGSIIPFGASVEHHIATRDQARLHQFGKKVLPGIFLGKALIEVGLWKGDILICRSGRIDNFGCIRNFSSANQRQRNIGDTKRRRIYFPDCIKTVRKRLRIP